MLQINGQLHIVPMSISTDIGKITMDGKEEAAVVQLLHTESGPVAVIYPTHAIDAVIEGLKKAKQDSNNDKSDIFVPSSDADVEQAKQFHDQITEGKQ